MKKYILISLCILIVPFVVLHANEIEQKSKITEATVFLNGAQINRTANINLQSGLNKIVFTKLSKAINTESFQVKTDKAVEIIDVNFSTKKINKEEIVENLEPIIKTTYTNLKNKIEAIRKTKDQLSSEIKIVDKQRNYLLNVKLGGDHNKETETKSKLSELLPFYNNEYTRLSKKYMELNERKKKEDKNYQKLNEELKSLIAKNNIQINQQSFVFAEVLVNSDFANNVNFNLKYLVSNANWQPIYDIRANSISEPIELTYKAKINQNTGINWDNVKLSVSSSNPTQSKERPILNPSYVSFYSNNYKEKSSSRVQNAYGVDADAGPPNAVPRANAYEAPAVYQTNEISMNYTLNRSYSIPSNNKPHFVNLDKKTINPQFVYHAVPKLDCSAYLVAKVKDWNNLNLISGNASLFFKNTFIGKSYINTKNLEDFLILSFGVDERINVERNKLNVKGKSNFLESKKTEVFAYEIKVQNNNYKNVEFELLDQYPLSNNGEIEVELLKSSKAEVNVKTGSLQWNFELKPNETKSFEFEYALKYPKNRKVAF